MIEGYFAFWVGLCGVLGHVAGILVAIVLPWYLAVTLWRWIFRSPRRPAPPVVITGRVVPPPALPKPPAESR